MGIKLLEYGVFAPNWWEFSILFIKIGRNLVYFLTKMGRNLPVAANLDEHSHDQIFHCRGLVCIYLFHFR